MVMRGPKNGSHYTSGKVHNAQANLEYPEATQELSKFLGCLSVSQRLWFTPVTRETPWHPGSTCGLGGLFPDAEEIVEWLDEHNFLLVNKKGVPTHFPHAVEKHPWVIDLTWCNAQATQNDSACEWAFNEDLSVGSDHIGITWKLDPNLVEIDNPLGLKYNMKEVVPKDCIKKFNKEIEIKLDNAANAFSKAMQVATNKVAPPQKLSPHAKLWWDTSCTQVLNQVQLAAQTERHKCLHDGFGDDSLHKNTKHEENHFQRLIKFKKGNWAVKTIENGSGPDVGPKGKIRTVGKISGVDYKAEEKVGLR
ncbi:hypothetical protein BDP27DRAFT_1436840 [Rhodocollybia butyracea]|uniref:Endonuclease/exonuclease/phosphatase domain-containing protein n=1 Tax=Rhodocollybia butyracea TaxID=206335 RepID=A0A9P5P3R2_9AGAR|nr:hypothetical protein BDP27DRAFT_1436840 [Rhodocollybia butyracea]